MHQKGLGREFKTQLSPAILQAIHQLSTVGGIEARGAIYTRREVVGFILDLAGYTAEKPLYEQRLLEPSFGGGDFLIPCVERLLASIKRAGKKLKAKELRKAIRGVELHAETYQATRQTVVGLLVAHKLHEAEANDIADHWLICDDFLLTEIEGEFDYVIGNPPYVRQELIPSPLLAEYRSRFTTLFDRADIYIPFIERSLRYLSKCGSLGFICADRWMKNRYGGPLRSLVSSQFHLKFYIDMYETQAFHTEVSAYPAITVITRENPGPTRIAHRPNICAKALHRLKVDLTAKKLNPNSSAKELAGITNGSEPWLLESPDQMAVIRRLEELYPTLEEAGCKVGIGVATGADAAFIGDFEELDVEDDRKLPLVTTRDIASGSVKWLGQGVINPFSDDGNLVDLDDYPRLKRYLQQRRSAIAKRHVAQKAPHSWYRTIDKIHPALTYRKKLLVPDIKGKAHVAYESGKLYPHHNLYYVTSDTWDLHALQAVLLSSVARMFVAMYSTKMRGGYLRFQAQYLRRIRIPLWSSVPGALRAELKQAAKKRDFDACNTAVFKLYKLTEDEQSSLGGNTE